MAGAKTKRRAARGKQTWLPGTAPKRIQELHEAAEAVIAMRNDEKSIKSEREGAEQTLLTLMRRMNRKVYACDGVNVSVVPREDKIAVTVRKDTDGEAAGQEVTE